MRGGSGNGMGGNSGDDTIVGTGTVTQMADEDPVDKIVKILNAHHNSLAWIDQKTRQLKKELTILGERIR